MSTFVRLTKQEKQATITFARPETRNALHLPMMRELAQTLTAVQQTPHLQLLVIEGEGGVFSAGGDIQMMLDVSSPDETKEAMDLLSSIAQLLYDMPVITIAHIEGAAAGLGLSIALSCDYVLAAKTAKIAMNFIGIGLVPDGGGHFFLAERIGDHKAKQLIWEGRTMLGQEAHNLGIVDFIAPEGNSSTTLTTLLQRLENAPLAAMIETKKIYQALKRPLLDQSLQLEATAQLAMRKTADHQEGIQAFLEKRHAKFIGE